MVIRLTPSSAHSWSSAGIRLPLGHAPSSIACASDCSTWCQSGSGRRRSGGGSYHGSSDRRRRSVVHSSPHRRGPRRCSAPTEPGVAAERAASEVDTAQMRRAAGGRAPCGSRGSSDVERVGDAAGDQHRRGIEQRDRAGERGAERARRRRGGQRRRRSPDRRRGDQSGAVAAAGPVAGASARRGRARRPAARASRCRSSPVSVMSAHAQPNEHAPPLHAPHPPPASTAEPIPVPIAKGARRRVPGAAPAVASARSASCASLPTTDGDGSSAGNIAARSSTVEVGRFGTQRQVVPSTSPGTAMPTPDDRARGRELLPRAARAERRAPSSSRLRRAELVDPVAHQTLDGRARPLPRHRRPPRREAAFRRGRSRRESRPCGSSLHPGA